MAAWTAAGGQSTPEDNKKSSPCAYMGAAPVYKARAEGRRLRRRFSRDVASTGAPAAPASANKHLTITKQSIRELKRR